MNADKPTILALSAIHPGLLDTLKTHFNVVTGEEYKANPDAYADQIAGIETFINQNVTADLIDSLPNLEIIASSAVGVDNIDLQHAWNKGIKVTNTPKPIRQPTAATALMHILNITRGGLFLDDFVRSGAWETKGSNSAPLSFDINKKKVGIIGLGGIGSDLATMLRACQMEVLYTGRSDKGLSDAQYYPSVVDLARESDVLVASCNLNDATRGIVNAEALKALGPQGFFVNVSRGGVVNESDLIQALQEDWIAGAGLDVFENEPHVSEALRGLPREKVIFSPHAGSKTVDARREMGAVTAQNLLAYFAKEELPDEVPQAPSR